MLQRIHNKISLFQICDLISVFKFGCFLFSKGDLGVYSINAQWSCFFFNSSWFSSTWIYDPFCSIEGFNNLTWKKLRSTDLENSHKRHSNKCKSPLWKYRLLDSLWFCKSRPYKSLHWVNIIMIKITWSLLATSWSWYIERKVKKKILLSRLTRHWAITNFSWLENPKFVNYVWASVVIFHRRVNDQSFIFSPLL